MTAPPWPGSGTPPRAPAVCSRMRSVGRLAGGSRSHEAVPSRARPGGASGQRNACSSTFRRFSVETGHDRGEEGANDMPSASRVATGVCRTPSFIASRVYWSPIATNTTHRVSAGGTLLVLERVWPFVMPAFERGNPAGYRCPARNTAHQRRTCVLSASVGSQESFLADPRVRADQVPAGA